MKITKDFIVALPKSELHCHLDGSVRLQSVIELAKEFNISLPDNREKLEELLICGRKVDSLVMYLDAFQLTLAVLQQKDALEKVAFELVEDAHNENIWCLEVRFSPMLHQKQGLSGNEVVEAVLRGLARGEKVYGVKAGLIICAMRDRFSEDSVAMANLAVEYYGQGVVAFDLAGGEIGNPARKHRKAFSIVRKKFMNQTIHAGEVFGPKSIEQALFYGAHRIGHGTSLLQNEELVEYINNHRIPLEVCPMSNFQTQSVPSLEEHPLPVFLKKGICVTINTDNRLMSDTDLSSEYWRAVNNYNLEWQELKQIIINGFESAFLPFTQKQLLLNKVHERLEVLKNDLGD